MTVRSERVTVGTTPVALVGTDSDYLPGQSIAIRAPAGATLYVGGADVTAGNGWPLDAGTRESYDLGAGEVLFGVLASGEGSVAVLRIGA